MININVLLDICGCLMIASVFTMGVICVFFEVRNEHDVKKKKRNRIDLAVLVLFLMLIIFSLVVLVVGININHGIKTGKYETDYSSVQTMNYEKITLTQNGESSKAVVYLKDGTSYVIRGIELFLPLYDYCVVKINDDNFADCFIKAGEKYTSKGNVFYAEISFDDNTLYVDEDTYNKIFGIEETEIVIKGGK